MTQKDLDQLVATGKIVSHNGGKGPKIDDLPPSKGLVPNQRSMSKAKADFFQRLAMYCQAKKLPLFLEQRFHPVREWRLDAVIPGRRPVALEYEGIMSEGVNGHTGIKHYVKDVQKYNAAGVAGILVLRYTARNYEEALSDLEMFLF